MARNTLIDVDDTPITLTKKQSECATYKGDKTLVIRGTAGSGKTYVLIKLAIELSKFVSAEEIPPIGILVYNKSLAESIKQMLKKNNADFRKIGVFTKDKYIADIQKNNDMRVIQRNYSALDNEKEKSIDIMKSVLKDGLIKPNHSRLYELSEEFWLDEIRWMYDNGIADWKDEDIYLKMKREGRCAEYKIRMSVDDRKVAFKIFDSYDRKVSGSNCFEWRKMHALLYREKKYELKKYGFKYLLIDEAQDFSLTDMRIAVKLLSSEKIQNINTDGLVHDVSVYNNNLFIAIDGNQNLYGHHWNLEGDILLEKPETKGLKQTFRCTYDIDRFSYELKKANFRYLKNEDKYEYPFSTIPGKPPSIVRCDSQQDEIDFIRRMIDECSKSQMEIAVLFRDNNSMKKFKDNIGLKSAVIGEDATYGTPGLKLSTIHKAKGLGFGLVIIPSFNSNVYPISLRRTIDQNNKDLSIIYKNNDKLSDDEIQKEIHEDIRRAKDESIVNDRKLVYVALTRAKANLILTYIKNKGSQFIDDFNPSYYKLINTKGELIVDPSIKPYIEDTKSKQSTLDEISKTSVRSHYNPLDAYEADKLIQKNERPDLTALLSKYALGDKVIDERTEGFGLLLLGSEELTTVTSELRELGYNFRYKKNGTPRTKNVPCWRLNMD